MNEIQLYNNIKSGDDIKSLASTALVLFGGNLNNAMGGVLIAITEKMSVLDVTRTYHLFDGKPTMKADAMLHKFQQMGAKWTYLFRDDAGNKLDARQIARAHVVYKEYDEIFEYTAQDAAESGKDSGHNYKHFKPDMLRARLITRTVRMLEPGINFGIYCAEELQEPQVERNVTPAEQPRSLVEQAEAILEPYRDSAYAFFLNRGLLNPGQTFRDLSTESLQHIVDYPTELTEKLTATPVAQEVV